MQKTWGAVVPATHQFCRSVQRGTELLFLLLVCRQSSRLGEYKSVTTCMYRDLTWFQARDMFCSAALHLLRTCMIAKCSSCARHNYSTSLICSPIHCTPLCRVSLLHQSTAFHAPLLMLILCCAVLCCAVLYRKNVHKKFWKFGRMERTIWKRCDREASFYYEGSVVSRIKYSVEIA